LEKALFWDFDGTLVYPDKKWSPALFYALQKNQCEISIEKIRQYLQSCYTWNTPEISYLENTGQKWWDKFFTNLETFYNCSKLPREKIKKVNLDFKNKILDCKNYTLYENAEAVLRKCTEAGYKNYILSNNFPELPDVIKDLGLAQYFTDYFVSANIGYEKPRTEIFQHALKTAQFPKICFMIGDNPVADIQGGKSAGMKTILVHTNDVTSGADYQCENLPEIPVISSVCPQSRLLCGQTLHFLANEPTVRRLRKCFF